MRPWWALLALAALALSLAFHSRPQLQPDELVELFPTYAYPAGAPARWNARLQGMVFETEEDSLSYALLQRLAQSAAGPMSWEERRRFSARVGLFLRDLERGKLVDLRVSQPGPGAGGPRVAMATREPPALTAANGLFAREVQLTSANGGWLDVAAEHEPALQRGGGGAVQLLAAEGVSVVSDIDDTIKETGVLNSTETLENTFLKPFRATMPGIAAAYRRWEAEDGAAFHYISGSPWQLYGPLSEWMATERFPRGSWDLKPFRLELGEEPDASVFDMLSTPTAFKLAALGRLFDAFPQRRFALIGDSGEYDPEVYGEVSRRYPGQVALVAIHDLPERPMAGDEVRLAAAFAGVPESVWRLFRAAEELPDSLVG